MERTTLRRGNSYSFVKKELESGLAESTLLRNEWKVSITHETKKQTKSLPNPHHTTRLSLQESLFVMNKHAQPALVTFVSLILGK